MTLFEAELARIDRNYAEATRALEFERSTSKTGRISQHTYAEALVTLRRIRTMDTVTANRVAAASRPR